MFSEKFYSKNLIDFLDETNDSSSPKHFFQLPKQQLSQKQIITQILHMLLGMPCSILTKKYNSTQYQLPDKYRLSHLSSTTLQNSLKQCIKVCNQTKYIDTQAKKLYEKSKNGIIKSFCESIFNYLHGNKIILNQMLSNINFINPKDKNCKQEKLTLLKITKIVKSNHLMFEFIIRCLNTCNIDKQRKSQTARILDKMWEIEQQLTPYSDFQKSELLKIFKKTLKIFIENIIDFLMMRKVSDDLDFFITTYDNIKNLPENFLYKNEEIELQKLPRLLESESKGILQIGKTIRFISLYYQDHQQQKLMKYFDVQGQFKLLLEAIKVQQSSSFRRVSVPRTSLNDRLKGLKPKAELQVNNNENPYEMFSKTINMFNISWVQKKEKNFIEPQGSEIKNAGVSKYEKDSSFMCNIRCLLLQILENINKKCLSFFKETHDILEEKGKNRIQASLQISLSGIRKFMLLQQGDFVEQFFNAAHNIIDKQKRQISHNRIYGCIDQAIQSSTVKNLPKEIINNIQFDFIKQAADQKKSQKMKLWVLFCFSFRQNRPINLIFNSQFMQKLKQICNMIIKLKRGQIVLIQIWNEFREGMKMQKSEDKVEKRSKIICSSLLNFLNGCLNHLLLKLSIAFTQFTQKLAQISTIFDIVSEATQLMTNLQKHSTNNKLFYNLTMQALLIIQKYRKLNNLLKNKDMIIPLGQFNQLEFQLRTVSQIVINIAQLNEIINYNKFYDKLQ